ncbi:protein FAR1-RELATED SEQUENCE 11-like [Lolium rigidum]|uniref:protein FAR1-RELATED SEQUENCE 11-like n=1 Tax=Lolium rigidum TaxID=89674 RepID=UPI001F5C6671|nr:protein FAR1-RELATED SEQUENCE 11-like [Lolium rigidum]
MNPAKSKVRQDITCGCEGKPRHSNSRSVCCGCRAMIRLHRTDDHGWYIHEFRRDHNHGLAVNSGQKMQFSLHRNIDPHTKDLVRNLRDNNVGLTKTFSVIGGFFGSMENIPFNKRSLRTLCASISRDHSEDDIRKTYEVLSEMKMKDPNFRDSCLVDSEGRIRALMWTNGKSRMQYQLFWGCYNFRHNIPHKPV